MFTDNYMGSALRHICAVLAVVAVVLATDIAFAQPIGSAPPDIRTGVYRGHVVTYEIIDGLAVWDGDIILGTPEELDIPGKALVAVSNIPKKRLWPGGIIPYVIDPELSHPFVLRPDATQKAIQHWNENTVIRLVERTDQPNWVRFVSRAGGCRAPVGMVGGEQKVLLSESCGPGAIVHEIGHAVGLWHEQQRNDRDPHVWVWSNPFIPPNARYSQKKGRLGLDIGPYDYGSVMHYTFRGQLNPIPPGIVLGKGGQQVWKSSDRGLSPGDIDGVSRLYGRIPTRTTVTTNLAGLMIEVDGEAYIAPHSFDWAPGTRHTIGVASPQYDVYNQYHERSWSIDYIRYLFAKWSDGGAQSHSVTASTSTTIFIANFIEQIRPELSAEPPHGGTVRLDPPPPTGFTRPFLWSNPLLNPPKVSRSKAGTLFGLLNKAGTFLPIPHCLLSLSTTRLCSPGEPSPRSTRTCRGAVSWWTAPKQDYPPTSLGKPAALTHLKPTRFSTLPPQNRVGP